MCGWVVVYVWKLELQRKLYTQGVIFKKTPRVPPSSLLGVESLVGICVCLEARVTKEIIYTRGDF